jgi:hypothetical protein
MSTYHILKSGMCIYFKKNLKYAILSNLQDMNMGVTTPWSRYVLDRALLPRTRHAVQKLYLRYSGGGQKTQSIPAGKFT